MFYIHQQTQVQHSWIGLYIEFEHIVVDEIQHDPDVQVDRAEAYKGMNNDSDQEFEDTYETGDEDEDEDDNGGGKAVAKTLVVPPAINQPTNVPPFMRSLDLDAIHVLEFPEYANIGVADTENGEFRIGLEYSSRKSVIAAIRSYTISRRVDYVVYEFEPQTIYAKCKTYGRGCDWLIRVSLIQEKACWEIRRYNGRHICFMGTISQDHSKLDSDTIAETMKSLVESDPFIKKNL
ncbi:uncharacterized protein LOC110272279 [Arachis ipaensis]|uniref:uncharacterized protein LOC110272279 n=1 Tax=Arachis ipaensis TaxID=130454 RepID=UPI000A2B24DF|nr:uncharacterized protein LOC110272279 [Arachis ipaensis]XP_025655239.1 uncharacterized protein LOC112750647 [Arachis hypogaea]